MIDLPGKRFNRSDIVSLFSSEFASIKDRFNIIELHMNYAEQDNSKEAAMPGVYVYLKDNKVWKVGRHLVNSRKRAIEHVNVKRTDYKVVNLKSDPEAVLLLFNLKEHAPKNGVDFRHWVAALEIFFELRLDPLEKSDRLG